MKTERNDNAINITSDWIKKQTSKGEIGTNIQSISNAIKNKIPAGDNIIVKDRELEYMNEFGLIIGMFLIFWKEKPTPILIISYLS